MDGNAGDTKNSPDDTGWMEQFESLLADIAASEHEHAARLASRLQYLAQSCAEDYEGRRLSLESADALSRYLAGRPSLGWPELTVTPAGKLYAEWQWGDRCRFSVEFSSLQDVRFIVFRPNPKHPRRTDHMSGSTTLDALDETVAPLLDAASVPA
jgi:hypothetical protein